MKVLKLTVRPHRLGFSLVELLVSMGLVSLLMLVLVSMTDSVRGTWSYTTNKIEEFRGAREAFETITRQLSQATLNTYWDYQYPNNDSSKAPEGYLRQSELRFLAGNSLSLLGGGNYPTQCVFFQANLGYSRTSEYEGLDTLLNTCGYYIKFDSDALNRPPFVNEPLRYRFRLMQLVEPSESLSLYTNEVKAGGNSSYTTDTWVTDPLGTAANTRVLADNVIALVILPRLTPEEERNNSVAATDDGSFLCPYYSYDSTKTDDGNDSTVNPIINWKNQLPPLVQVTLVAVDDAGFKRMQKGSNSMPDLGLGGLFQQSGKSKFDADMATLTAKLQKSKLNYRIFSTNVSIRSAKWSRDQAY